MTRTFANLTIGFYDGYLSFAKNEALPSEAISTSDVIQFLAQLPLENGVKGISFVHINANQMESFLKYLFRRQITTSLFSLIGLQPDCTRIFKNNFHLLLPKLRGLITFNMSMEPTLNWEDLNELNVILLSLGYMAGVSRYTDEHSFTVPIHNLIVKACNDSSALSFINHALRVENNSLINANAMLQQQLSKDNIWREHFLKSTKVILELQKEVEGKTQQTEALQSELNSAKTEIAELKRQLENNEKEKSESHKRARTDQESQTETLEAVTIIDEVVTHSVRTSFLVGSNSNSRENSQASTDSQEIVIGAEFIPPEIVAGSQNQADFAQELLPVSVSQETQINFSSPLVSPLRLTNLSVFTSPEKLSLLRSRSSSGVNSRRESRDNIFKNLEIELQADVLTRKQS